MDLLNDVKYWSLVMLKASNREISRGVQTKYSLQDIDDRGIMLK